MDNGVDFEIALALNCGDLLEEISPAVYGYDPTACVQAHRAALLELPYMFLANPELAHDVRSGVGHFLICQF